MPRRSRADRGTGKNRSAGPPTCRSRKHSTIRNSIFASIAPAPSSWASTSARWPNPSLPPWPPAWATPPPFGSTRKTGIDFFMGVQYKDNRLKSLDELRNMPISLRGAGRADHDPPFQHRDDPAREHSRGNQALQHQPGVRRVCECRRPRRRIGGGGRGSGLASKCRKKE